MYASFTAFKYVLNLLNHVNLHFNQEFYFFTLLNLIIVKNFYL